MRIAIIDIGTNTFNLLIASLNESRDINFIHTTKLSVRLGEGGFNNNYLTDSAIERGVLAIKSHIRVAKDFNATHVIAFATSAVRNASNKSKFLSLIKNNFNLDINVIDGNKEAELIYAGVKTGLDIGNNLSLIMDIGGGSTEFIISNQEQLFFKQSIEIGAARLLDKFKPSDPITEEEIMGIEVYLENELKELFENIKSYNIDTLIGSSGSFDTFAEMISHRFYTPDLIKGKREYNFKMEDYQVTHNQIIKSTLEERLNTRGLIEMRADMIVVASILVNLIIRKLEIKNMRLSTFSLKEGVISEIKNGKHFNINELNKA